MNGGAVFCIASCLVGGCLSLRGGSEGELAIGRIFVPQTCIR
jgi:hypothetical protein